MVVYLSAFTATILLLFASRHTNSAKIQIVLVVAAAIPLCIVAGIRDKTVGTDTSTYPLLCFNASQLYSPIVALGICSDQEPLFVLLFWILGRITGNFGAVLFISEALITIPYFLIARKLFPNGYPIVGIFFCFVIYGYTLNIVRQCLAMTLLVGMLYAVMKRKSGCALLLLILATGIHKMAVLGAFIWILYDACTCRYRGEPRKTVALLLSLGFATSSICAILIGPDLMKLVSELTTSYSFQVRHAGTGSFNTIMLIYLPFCLAMGTLGLRRGMSGEWRERTIFFMLSGSVASLLAQFSSISPELIRISFPFLMVSGYLYSQLMENPGRVRIVVTVLATVMSVLYFTVTYVIGGSCDLFPYSSAYLGISYV